MALHVKVTGTWRRVANTYVKVSGTWHRCQNIYVKVAGAWKPLYSYAWNVGGWSGCSATCGGGTQTRSVKCMRNDGQQVDGGDCVRAGMGNAPAASQACNTQSCYRCLYSKNVNYVLRGSYNEYFINGKSVCRNTGIYSPCGAYSAGILKDTSESCWNNGYEGGCDTIYYYEICGNI